MNLKPYLQAAAVAAVCLSAPLAMADHNSIWGEGWANMPNDIHNTRLEDDDETFFELVQGGDGADSVNRYLEEDEEVVTGRDRLDMWYQDMGAVMEADARLGEALRSQPTAGVTTIGAGGGMTVPATGPNAMTTAGPRR